MLKKYKRVIKIFFTKQFVIVFCVICECKWQALSIRFDTEDVHFFPKSECATTHYFFSLLI